MPKFCCVGGCPNSGKLRGGTAVNEHTLGNDSNVSLSFHTFPKDPITRQEWISVVRRDDNFSPSYHSVVCLAHFKPEEFYPTYASGLKKLRENVVPSIFDFCDDRFNSKQFQVNGYKKIRPCSCETSSDNTLDYPELKVLLPPGYSYHVCEWTDLGPGCFDTLFRVNVPTEDSAYLWLKEFQMTSRSKFYRDKTWTHDGITIIFKVKKSVCNTKTRSIDVKHTNCSAKLLITIKETHKRNCQSSDIHLPAYPMIVTYRNTHNHQLKNSDNVEATTKPFVHFLRSAEESDPSTEIVLPISDSSDNKSEVLKATENLMVEPDFHTIIDDQFEVDDSNLSDEDFPLDNIEHTSETQKTNIPEIDSPQQIKVERTEIQKANVSESVNNEQTTTLPQIDLTQVNKVPLILIQNIIPVPLQNPFLMKADLIQDKKEQTLKDFLSFANKIADKARSNKETFRSVKSFMENVKNMNSNDSINSALVNFGKINRSANLEKKNNQIQQNNEK